MHPTTFELPALVVGQGDSAVPWPSGLAPAIQQARLDKRLETVADAKHPSSLPHKGSDRVLQPSRQVKSLQDTGTQCVTVSETAGQDNRLTVSQGDSACADIPHMGNLRLGTSQFQGA